MYNKDNIVEIDDYILGRFGDVIPYFMNNIMEELKKVDFNNPEFECCDVENVKDNVDLCLDFINGLYQDKITSTITNDTFIKVIYNPMGAYQYTIFGESDDLSE